jgi:naphthalene 1,2-dioxygenase ferredoxin reductase component
MTVFALQILDGDRVSGSADQSVLDACLDAGVAFPYNCRSGECGECLARLVSGDVRELPGADPAVFDDQKRRQGFILACLSYPRSDLELAVQLRADSGPPIREFDTIVTSVRRHSPSIVEIVVRADPPIDYRAGQYFDWVLPGIAPHRSFSAANRPGTSRIEFHVRVYPGGRVSQRVARGELMAGDVLTLHGPFGSAGLSADEYRPAILVAGGTGLAPIKSVLDEAFARGSSRSLQFFYGTRRREDLYHLETMTAWASKHPNFSFVPVLSDEPKASDWTGERGMVTEAVARDVTDAFGAEAFLCGPPPMIDAAIPLLRKLGVDNADIHYDKFTPVA